MAEQAIAKPPTVVELVWEHDLVFAGNSGETSIRLDSASKEGPSPMQALAFGLAGCMAMDVVHVLKKGRHDLRGMRADLTGERAQEDPRRFTAITLKYTITGNVPEDQVARAIQLSRDKYCSVWHSLRQDIPFDVTFSVTPGA
ncbi:MAG TPA: OsmC family protein [Vicinamibacterales bacterium]